MSAWKWMARICSKTPWMKTWSLRVYYWWKKLQYQKGYVEKEENGRRIRGGVIIAEEEEASFHTVGAVAFMLALCPDGTGC